MRTRRTMFAAALPLIVASLAGCAAAPEPTEKRNTLLVGKFVVNWSGHGSYKHGVMFKMKNTLTGKTFYCTTFGDGWLFSNKLTQGVYEIARINFATSNYKVWFDGPFYITITDGVVNNIGSIKVSIVNYGKWKLRNAIS